MTERRNAGMAKPNPPPSLAQGLDLPPICTLRNENLQVLSRKVLVKNLLRTVYSLTIITVKTRFLSVVEFFVDRDQMTACQSCKIMAAFSLRLYLAMEVNSHFLENKFGDPSLFLCCFEMRNKFIYITQRWTNFQRKTKSIVFIRINKVLLFLIKRTQEPLIFISKFKFP